MEIKVIYTNLEIKDLIDQFLPTTKPDPRCQRIFCLLILCFNINQLYHLLKILWRNTYFPGCPTYLPEVLNLNFTTTFTNVFVIANIVNMFVSQNKTRQLRCTVLSLVCRTLISPLWCEADDTELGPDGWIPVGFLSLCKKVNFPKGIV